MNISIQNIILDLFDIGAIEFGAFKFKHHEKYPDAPLAPMKINLRTPNHPNGGRLTPNIVSRIAFLFLDLIEEYNLEFDCVAGIPRAGDPFARIVANILDKPLITAEKIEIGGKREISKVISSRTLQPGQKVLLIDDVITKGYSKKESVQCFEKAGLEIAAIILLIDREEGGMDAYTKLGYNIYAVLTISEMLNFGLLQGKISPVQHERCFSYMMQASQKDTKNRKNLN
jgi:orotate phosphoribosyltransferase